MRLLTLTIHANCFMHKPIVEACREDSRLERYLRAGTSFHQVHDRMAVIHRSA